MFLCLTLWCALWMYKFPFPLELSTDIPGKLRAIGWGWLHALSRAAAFCYTSWTLNLPCLNSRPAVRSGLGFVSFKSHLYWRCLDHWLVKFPISCTRVRYFQYSLLSLGRLAQSPVPNCQGDPQVWEKGRDPKVFSLLHSLLHNLQHIQSSIHE